LTLALTACAAPLPPTPREHPASHPTIVSLNPCTDAILAEVAGPGQILAISHYSHDPRATSMDPAAAHRFRAIGGTAEEIAALAPDLVVGSSFMNAGTRAALTRLGMRVETFGAPATVDESLAQVRTLARLAGHPARGEALVRAIEAAVRKPPGPRIETALWQAGGIVPGKGTLVTDLLQRAGFASYAEVRRLAQGEYLPLERLLADPPELLLIAGAERAHRHPAVGRLPGVRVARFDPRLFFCGGPSIPRAMARLRDLRRSFETQRGTPDPLALSLSKVPAERSRGVLPARFSASLEPVLRQARDERDGGWG
jgi:iron complex transport system substrate-binding protein